MTKLDKTKTYEITGKRIRVKNLLTVDGKNLSVPIDVDVAGEDGDIVHVWYGGDGFVKNSEMVEKGKPEPVLKQQEKKEETKVPVESNAPVPTQDIYGDPYQQIPPRTGPNERQIVAQLLIKKWTDLYIGSNVLEPGDFDAARKEILKAVEEDLDKVMDMGRTPFLKNILGGKK